MVRATLEARKGFYVFDREASRGALLSSHSAKVIADSISPAGTRLTTLEVVMPRIVLAEFNTHRMFSRNSASSRAIPVQKMIKMVETNPYVPSSWGKNQKGMSAEEDVPEKTARMAELAWLEARDEAVIFAQELLDLGIHKQLTNRLLEPFMWHTVIVTATEWSNFFNLRCHPAAHPDIRIVANKMKEAMNSHRPKQLGDLCWHLPYINNDDICRLDLADQIKVSCGRCARVSYLTHDGIRDTDADIQLHDRLLQSGHMSPFEHVARPHVLQEFVGNFYGWVQYRKTIVGESDILNVA